jgi:hypothetical protein
MELPDFSKIVLTDNVVFSPQDLSVTLDSDIREGCA